MIDFILMTIGFLIIFITSIIIHEYGHVIYFKRKLGKSVNVKWGFLSAHVGTLEDYTNLTKTQYVGVNMSGIGLGMLPILIVSFQYPFFLILLIPYFVGCRQDIKEVWDNIDWETQ